MVKRGISVTHLLIVVVLLVLVALLGKAVTPLTQAEYDAQQRKVAKANAPTQAQAMQNEQKQMAMTEKLQMKAMKAQKKKLSQEEKLLKSGKLKKADAIALQKKINKNTGMDISSEWWLKRTPGSKGINQYSVPGE